MGFSLLMFSDAPSGTLGILVQKKLCFGSRLGGRHMGQVRTAGSIHKKIVKSGVLESPTLTKLQFGKKKCLGFTLKDFGCSFCTHVFGK